jgi:ketosteroid isomerase-like protein
VSTTQGKGGKSGNTETLQAIYEAFGRGDVAAILDKLDDSIDWETTVPVSDVPWLQARRGKANIAGFFESMAPLKITRFEPHTVRDGGDRVFVLINLEATTHGRSDSFPNNGRLWQFNASGKVVRYDHVTDTAQMIRMAKGQWPLPGLRIKALAGEQVAPTPDPMAIFLVSPLGCREQEPPQWDPEANPAIHGEAAVYISWLVIEMTKSIVGVLYSVAMIAVVVGVDLLFFKNRFWERLMVNIGIVLVFAAFYLRFLKHP